MGKSRGLINLLQSEGWVLDSAPTPAFGDASSCLKLLSKRCPEGAEVLRFGGVAEVLFYGWFCGSEATRSAVTT